MAGGEPAGGLGNGEGSRADAVENRSGVVDRVRPLPIRGSCRRQRVGARGPAVHTPLSDKISRYTLEGCDWKGLLELIERIRKRVTREFGPSVEMISCYEASYDGFWLHRLLEGHGVRNHVIDPASLQVDRRVRRAKTDRIDAARLLRSLMAHVRGEPKVWSVVRVPSVAEEYDRRLHRERDRLINERGQHVNRIKGLCAVHGIYDYEPMHSKRMPRLERLRTATGDQLPRQFKEEIKRELQRLELVLQMIKAIETERDAIASAKASTHTNAKKIQKLVKLRGIGSEFATVLVGEVFFRPFSNRHRWTDAEPFSERVNEPRSG
jgi:transposase